jgi:hypothetical protein
VLDQPNNFLWSTVQDAIARRDLEGHLAALVLHTGFRASADAALPSPWTPAVRDLLEDDVVPAGPLRRTHDVATVGVRLALGGACGRAAEYADAARRELAREPMPPAACVRDDERFLLGVAAGIGVAAPNVVSDLTSVLRAREYTATLRQVCIDLWAAALAVGEPRFTKDTARRAYSHLTTRVPGRTTTGDDWIAAFWLATRLFDAPLEPTDAGIAALDSIMTDGRRMARAVLVSGRPLTPLDAAFLLDALSVSPLDRFARRSALDGVLAVIEAFPKSAAVLAKRKRGRPPFQIADEYDVQDLFYALVLPIIPDIVDEDPAPKVAGRSTRLDFTSKATRLGFEVKHVNGGSRAETVRKEILLDQRTYQEHPYIDTVVAFIWDPERYIAPQERPAFEADLSQTVTVGGRTVRYVVRVR